MTETALTPDQQAIAEQALLPPIMQQADPDGDASDVTVIRGYAGTGKTVTTATIINHILQANKSARIVVLAPTAAALSVISGKLPQDPRVATRTCASVTSTPIEQLSMGPNGPVFNLNEEGITNAGTLLGKLGVDTSHVIELVDKRNHRKSFVDMNNPPSEYMLGKSFISVNTDLLQSRINKAVPNARMFQCSSDTSSMLIDAPEVAERIMGKARGGEPPAAIIVDEWSMVNADVADLLVMSAKLLGTKLILCGDGGQLEPVEGAPNRYLGMTEGRHTAVIERNNTTFYATVYVHELNKILRSNDSVAQLAQEIRAGQCIAALEESDSFIREQETNPKQLVAKHPDLFRNAGAVVTFRNKNVTAFNNELRALHGRSGSICEKDRLVCTMNTYGEHAGAFRNGEIMTVTETNGSSIQRDIDTLEAIANNDDASSLLEVVNHINLGNLVGVTLDSDGTVKTAFVWDDKGKVPYYKKRTYAKMVNALQNLNSPIIMTQYAYALTVHKAQGSEWDNVVYVTSAYDLKLLSSPNMPYTAVTRAKRQATIIYTN